MVNLIELTDSQKEKAYKKYQIIEPYINDKSSLKSIARKTEVDPKKWTEC